MSTKIYNGYRIDCDIALLYDRLIGVKPGFQKLADDQIRKHIARRATEIFDRRCVAEAGGRAWPDCMPRSGSLSMAWEEVREAFDEVSKGHRQPFLDFDAELVIFPNGSRCYVMTMIENREQMDLFRSLSWGPDPEHRFREYGYWDNADPPEGVPMVAFKRRGRVWEALMGRSMVPAHRGLIFQLSRNQDTRINVNRDEIVEYVPDIETRSKTIASDMAMTAYMNGLIEEHGQVEDLSHFHAAMRWLGTDEGINDKLKIQSQIMAVMKPEITTSDLLGWNPEED